MFLPSPLVLLDLETTGPHPERDRIIEIALTRYENDQITLRWHTLINPGISLPPLIREIVGLTDADLATAPSFCTVAPQLLTHLAGATLAAHNVRFDYGFLKNSFARCGISFTAPLFCTVKFAKALEPQHHKHGLDALIARHHLTSPARHRAVNDVAVLEQYLALALSHHPPEQLLRARRAAMKHPARPVGLSEGALEAVPEVPGVYLFYGDNDLPLYIGTSKTLRSRVHAHFSPAQQRALDHEIARQIRRLDWIETAGPLHAQLLENELVKTLHPRYNKQLRPHQDTLALLPTGIGTPQLRLVHLSVHHTDPRTWLGRAFGLFPDSEKAERALKTIAHKHALCSLRLGWEPSHRQCCTAYQLGRCRGVCAGQETLLEHDQRLLEALRQLPPHPWPYAAPILIGETAPQRRSSFWLLVDHWCLLARFSNYPDPAEVTVAYQTASYRFDRDIYHILKTHLTPSPSPSVIITPIDRPNG
ncbi:MAG: exonuclease domain-containing protein [Hydrogenophilus sp.]|nr:exonuclease domain-containing protein [Hydrogenophilus sp.]